MHRDLKSLNILLDNKWNAKVIIILIIMNQVTQCSSQQQQQVSDFGLTKFKNEIKQKGTKNALGTVHWYVVCPRPFLFSQSYLIDVVAFFVRTLQDSTRNPKRKYGC